MGSNICFLKSVKSSKKISLPDGVKVILGRNPETGIVDRTVSRKQILCEADTKNETVSVTVVGQNFSGVNGYALEKNVPYLFKSNDILELCLGNHEFEILFEEDLHPNPKKLKLDTHGQPEPSTSGLKTSDENKWEDIDNKSLLIYTTKNCVPQSKIAAFDVDGTIIRTKSGARFPQNADDWVFNFDNVKKKLQQEHANGYKIVFFTNQAGIGKNTTIIKDYKKKAENLVNKLDIPLQIYVATGRTKYRKPIPGMWEVLKNQKNSGIDIDLSKSFYVGDAAGRDKNWAPKKKKDHSVCDRLFALNIGIKFYTPEEYFLKATPVKYILPEFDPKNNAQANYPEIEYKDQEVILMVGMQGSGKSYFCKKEIIPKGYTHINRDKLGSWQKCLSVLEECLNQKKSAVVDNTNPDKDSRKKFIEVAKKYGVKCRCFLMTTSYKNAKHNNKFRELTDKSHVQINDMVINMYKGKFQEPNLDEGFDEIIKIPFVPEFESSEKEKIYKLYLLES